MQKSALKRQPQLPDWLRVVPYNDIKSAWSQAIPDPDDLAQVGRVCWVDRFFLLTQVLHRKDAWHPWVYERCREVESDPDGYIDLWGRGHFKSSIITFAGSVQEIIRDSEITIGVFSHTGSIAKAFLAQLKREFESNQDLKRLFPEIFFANPERESPSWSVDNGIIVKRRGNPKESTVEAHGLVDGQPTSRHYSLMIYDDVVVERSVATEDQISKTTECWSLSDNLGSRNSRRWYVGTRYSYHDTYATIIDMGAAVARIHPATDDGTMTGKPVLLSEKEWEDKKTHQLEATIACQLLCNPQAGNQRMFDALDIERYEARPATLTVYLLVDPAHSLKKESADTAMVVLGIDAAGNKYLLDGVAHRMELADKWSWLRDLYAKWRREPGVARVDVGYERYGAISDLAYFRERMQMERVQFNIEELAWPKSGGGTKKDRIQRLGPDFQQHNFFVPYPTHEDRLTSLQTEMIQDGSERLIARRITRLDENRKVYDLTERFLMQVSDFPFCQKKDIIDAVSRIYDMDICLPVSDYSCESLEPEYT